MGDMIGHQYRQRRMGPSLALRVLLAIAAVFGLWLAAPAATEPSVSSPFDSRRLRRVGSGLARADLPPVTSRAGVLDLESLGDRTGCHQ